MKAQIHQTKLVVFAPDAWHEVFSRLEEVCPAHLLPPLGDNGGEPDGIGPYIRALGDFIEECYPVLRQAEREGLVKIVDGYAISPYRKQVFAALEFCGYSSEEIAFTANKDVAHAIAKAQEEEDEEDR